MKSTAAFSRHNFLKIGLLSLASLAAPPWVAGSPFNQNFPSTVWPPGAGMWGRVTNHSTWVYSRPSRASRKLRKLARDEIIPLLGELQALTGPAHNPRWYALQEGYLHSGSIQRVETAHFNPLLESVPESGLLGEITVPYTQSEYLTRSASWRPVYRLYFGSTHWITGMNQDETGQTWYLLTDEWLKLRYRVLARHVHPMPPQELTPLSPDVPPEAKRVEVWLASQRLTAYEGAQQVYEAPVSTGQRWMETPQGEFSINRKTASKHMGDGELTADLRAYELVGVPWVSFFHNNGVAFHGAFWHDDFGRPHSHGCVNLRIADARWLFCWSAPEYHLPPASRQDWQQKGNGTRVLVLDA